MNLIPIYDATAPIVCTADSEEVPKRIEQIEWMRERLDQIERTENGLLLHFPNDRAMDAALRQFAVDEKGCCQFWGFNIETEQSQITLQWDGPPDVADFMNKLHEWFLGNEPLTADTGLL